MFSPSGCRESQVPAHPDSCRAGARPGLQRGVARAPPIPVARGRAVRQAVLLRPPATASRRPASRHREHPGRDEPDPERGGERVAASVALRRRGPPRHLGDLQRVDQRWPVSTAGKHRARPNSAAPSSAAAATRRGAADARRRARQRAEQRPRPAATVGQQQQDRGDASPWPQRIIPRPAPSLTEAETSAETSAQRPRPRTAAAGRRAGRRRRRAGRPAARSSAS